MVNSLIKRYEDVTHFRKDYYHNIPHLSTERGLGMPSGYSRSGTLPKDVVDEVQKFLEVHKSQLRKMGIKKISHVFERAWYVYKDQLESSL